MHSRPTTFVALFFVLLFVGCADRSRSAPDTVTTAISGTINSIHPLYATDAAGQHIAELVYFPLVATNNALQTMPFLAESFRIVNDKEIRFRLRDGCHFQDGTLVTSQAVADAVNMFLDEKLKSPHTESLKTIQNIKIHSNSEFSLILSKPDPSILAYLPTIKIFKATAIPSSSDASGDHLIGSGAFRPTGFQSTEVTLTRFNNGCMPLPAFQYLKIKVVRDDLSRFLKLKNGELDLVLNEMNYRKVEIVARGNSPDLRATSSPGIGYTYMGLNRNSPRLRDPRVRQALALSFDIPSLIKYKSLGYAKPAATVLPPDSFFANKQIRPVHRNLRKARRLLDQAGYFNGSNHKPPLAITLKTSSNNAVVENAMVLSAQAKEAGIELVPSAYEWGIFYKDVKTGNTESYLLRWVGVTDPGIYNQIFHSDGKNNRTGFHNFAVDRLLDLASATLDPRVRKRALDRVQRIAAEDLPYVNLWHNDNTVIYRKEISGVKLYTTGSWRTFLHLKKGAAGGE